MLLFVRFLKVMLERDNGLVWLEFFVDEYSQARVAKKKPPMTISAACANAGLVDERDKA